MKIGIIRRQFAKSGGAELYTQRLIQGMVDRNHEPHLFAENWAALPEGAVFHKVESVGGRADRNQLFAQRAGILTKAAKLDCVLSLDRTVRQDVYRAGDGVHQVWLERWRRFSPWWKRPFVGRSQFHRNMLELERHTFDPQNTGHVIVNSEMIRNEIVQTFDFPPERIHLIRNGIETNRMAVGDRGAARVSFGFDENNFVMVFVGSGWARKGLRFVINAFKLLPEKLNARLLIVGKGHRPFWSDSRVTYAGPRSDMHHIYAASDLLVTLPIYEPSANVVFEGLAAGLPVITSAYNGAGEVLEEGITGSVVSDPSDAGEVARRMQFWMTREKSSRQPIGMHAALDVSRNVEETLALLQRASAERRERQG
jgi:UDP-glucose:(heptosyl)LPS alpha-1,3-glucosyltransferase